MNKINLTSLELKTFTEQDALDYCQLNNINPLDINELDLSWNKLTDVSGIKLFKNLEELYLYNNNKIKNISILKNLIKLKILSIVNCSINNITVLKYLNKLERIDLSKNEIKDISIIQYLTKLEYLDINYLKLESNQIKYINSCKNLEFLICGFSGFKDKSVILKKINENIILE